MHRQSHPSMLCCTHSNDTHHFLLTQGVDSTTVKRVESTKHQRIRTPPTLWCRKFGSAHHIYDRLRFIYNNTLSPRRQCLARRSLWCCLLGGGHCDRLSKCLPRTSPRDLMANWGRPALYIVALHSIAPHCTVLYTDAWHSVSPHSTLHCRATAHYTAPRCTAPYVVAPHHTSPHVRCVALYTILQCKQTIVDCALHSRNSVALPFRKPALDTPHTSHDIRLLSTDISYYSGSLCY
jgi:hypothetical protein